MKIVRFERFGPAHEVCACVDAPDPGPPGDGEAVVRVEAFPINPVDLLTIAGEYADKPPLPATPGSEGVGVVESVGPGVTNVKAGDRVLLMGRNNWASKKRDKAKALLPVAAELDVLQAAMLKINPATAWLMLKNYGGLKRGDWLIQNAANSGVGRLVIRIAKAHGFRTVNVVRRKELVEPLKKLGADVVVVDCDDLAKRVREATAGADIRLAIDAVAGAATLRLSECVGDGATVVNYGRLSGEPCMVSPNRVIFAGVTLTGFWLVRHLGAMSDGERRALYADLGKRVAAGELKTEVEAVFAIADIGKALAQAAREGRGGKVLVRP